MVIFFSSPATPETAERNNIENSKKKEFFIGILNLNKDAKYFIKEFKQEGKREATRLQLFYPPNSNLRVFKGGAQASAPTRPAYDFPEGTNQFFRESHIPQIGKMSTVNSRFAISPYQVIVLYVIQIPCAFPDQFLINGILGLI
jgi:hypothetical protein